MDRETSPPISVSSHSEKAHRTDAHPSLTSPKASAIQEACEAADIKTLVALAASEGGLLTDELRQIACKLPLHNDPLPTWMHLYHCWCFSISDPSFNH
jgi:hypothetical protein